MKCKKILLFILLVISMFTLAACSDEVSIKVSADNYELSAGEWVEIYVDVYNSDSSYTLTVSDNSVATLVENGLKVKTDITEDVNIAVIATLDSDNSIIDTKLFSINAPKIDITSEITEISKGQKYDLGVNVSGVNNKSITWSYSVPNIIDVSKTNEVSVISDVTVDTKVVLTATLNYNPNIKATKTITVKAVKLGDLTAPKNVKISSTGLITWSKVEGATSYLVKINNTPKLSKTTSYQVGSLYSDFEYSVAAVRNDVVGPYSAVYTFKAQDPYANVTVGVKGPSVVKSGKTIVLSAIVNEAGSNDGVTWSIKEGSDYATINEEGRLTANNVEGDKIVEVVATSVANPKVSATKIITITAKPQLTQEMLNSLNTDKIGFEGYLNISLYKFGISSSLYQTTTVVVKTSMDGTNWYAEYDNTATGTTSGLYYKNHNDVACQVGVSFTNEEQFEPMVDDSSNPITFIDSGLYNNFKGLKVSDFTFNESTWRYEYAGSDKTLAERMIASANPYDFKTINFSLIIDEGEIVGIHAESDDDYTVYPGYRAVQELIVAVNTADTVNVPNIQKYKHDEVHDKLNEAIKNMQQLTTYKLDFKSIAASYMTNGFVESGYEEIITENECYFVPYNVTYSTKGEEIHTPIPSQIYGYHKFDDNLYNSYTTGEDGTFVASRAYDDLFNNAKPSFAFAGEIFTHYYYDEKEDSTTYYVDNIMSSVASTFYYGVGNDINLYGIFATEGFISNTESFTPYVTVKDGYITEACFYFFLGSMYGVVELKYSDFNTASLPSDVKIDFEPRQIPSSWDQLTIQVSAEAGTTAEDVEENALTYLKEFYNDENISDRLPFFGNILGDTYGFGLTTFHIPNQSNVAKKAIVFYYDVPLDVDYTINSSLKAIDEYLLSLGFSKNEFSEYSKNGINIAPVDSSLDLLIYIW